MKQNPDTSIEHNGLISKEVSLVNPLPPNRYNCLRVDWIIIGKQSENWDFLGIFPKKGKECHLFLNKIVNFGGPKSDIFIPNCAEEGGRGVPPV